MGFLSRVRRGAAVVVVPLVLVACGDESPAPSASESVTVSPSPSATRPVAPELPQKAEKNSPDGAEAFTRYFFEVVTHAMQTGDTAPLKAVSDPDCKTCAGLSEAIDHMYGEGRRNEGGGWIVNRSAVDPSLEMPFRKFLVIVDQPPQRLIDADGKVADKDPQTLLAFRVTVRWADTRWIAYEVVEEKLPGEARS